MSWSRLLPPWLQLNPRPLWLGGVSACGVKLVFLFSISFAHTLSTSLHDVISGWDLGAGGLGGWCWGLQSKVHGWLNDQEVFTGVLCSLTLLCVHLRSFFYYDFHFSFLNKISWRIILPQACFYPACLKTAFPVLEGTTTKYNWLIKCLILLWITFFVYTISFLFFI